MSEAQLTWAAAAAPSAAQRQMSYFQLQPFTGNILQLLCLMLYLGIHKCHVSLFGCESHTVQ